MIIFQNIEYKTREIEIPDLGCVLVSTNVLNEQLLNEDGSYISDTASMIDENIFYFVDESEMELPDADLRTILNEMM